jgi:hypothetical protein
MKSGKFTVTSVSTESFNSQVIHLENDVASITVRLKDQRDFDQVAKGDQVEFSPLKKNAAKKEKVK